MNYLTDMIFDELIHNGLADEAMHFLIEVGLGPGTPEQRVRRWLRKMAKYRHS